MTITTSNVIAKVAAVVAGLGLVLSAFAVALPSKAATVAELEAELAALKAAQGSSASTCTFTRDLTVGSQGADVTCLQTTLAAKGYFTVAPTGYFGTVTQAAVAKWQAAAGITPAAGYFGPISRAKFAAMGGSTGGNTGGSTGGNTGSGLSGGEADLSDFELRREESTGDEGEEEVEVATAEFDVEDGDVRVERMEIMASSTNLSLEQNPWDYFDRVIVWADGEEIGDMDVDDRDAWDEEGDDVYRLTLTGLDYEVSEGDRAEITFGFDIADSIDETDLDQTFVFYVDDEGIRATDGEGIQQYTGQDSETVTFGFGEEENGDLRVRSNSEDPDSSILVSDDEDESEEYTVFMFNLENRAEDVDALITDLTIGVNETGSGSTTAEIVRRATLEIGGDEFDGDIADTVDGSINFDDIDVEVAGDEEVEATLMITLVRNAPNATIEFDVDGATDIEAEGADTGDDADVEGTAESATHTVATTGIAIEPVSTSQSVTTPGDTSSNTYGTYTIKFDVTALEDDAYINDAAASTTAATNGATFAIFGDTYAGPAASAVLSSTAELESGFYRVDEGDTETFTLTVTLNPTTAGTYGVRLNEVLFNDSAANYDTTLTVDPSNEDYRTDAVYIAN